MNTSEKMTVTELARQRQLFMQVCACTHELVHSAMQASWNTVLDSMDRRRQLVTGLSQLDGIDEQSLRAIESAVTESEKAMWGVIAHAISGTFHHGAPHSLYM